MSSETVPPTTQCSHRYPSLRDLLVSLHIIIRNRTCLQTRVNFHEAAWLFMVSNNCIFFSLLATHLLHYIVPITSCFYSKNALQALVLFV